MYNSLLKVARINSGISLNDLANKTGISVNTLRSYENETSEPDIERIVKIATALNIPLIELGIEESAVNFRQDDIAYSKRYIWDRETYFLGKCQCGRDYFVKQKDIDNELVTKCKYCVASDLENQGIIGDLTDKEIMRLDTLYQNRIVKRAQKIGVDCTLSLHDYLHLITKPCHYCGKAPTQVEEIGDKVFIHNGIDRIDSRQGYVYGNVVPCCSECNMAKGSLTETEFYELIERIYKNTHK